ncbi:hypothetical protein JOE60_000273 [Paenarthrobacter ilicis]|nr:hypothetical protein [Paenarthrobacter ilicis]
MASWYVSASASTWLSWPLLASMVSVTFTPKILGRHNNAELIQCRQQGRGVPRLA